MARRFGKSRFCLGSAELLWVDIVSGLTAVLAKGEGVVSRWTFSRAKIITEGPVILSLK